MVKNPPANAGETGSIPDPTCRRATKPMHHNYWDCALEPGSCSYWIPCTQNTCSTIRKATPMRSLLSAMKSSPRSPQLREKPSQQWRSSTAKNKFIFKDLVLRSQSGQLSRVSWSSVFLQGGGDTPERERASQFPSLSAQSCLPPSPSTGIILKKKKKNPPH